MKGRTSVHLWLVAVLDVWSDVFEEGDVLVGVKLCHVLPTGGFRDLNKYQSALYRRRLNLGTYTHIHLSMHVIVDDKVVYHAHSMRFHRMLPFP
jgi:hypothetical protein